MGLLQNTMNGLKYKHWAYSEAFAYFLKGVARELKIAPSFFLDYYTNVVCNNFKKKWLKKNENEDYYFDINGAKLPDISADKNIFLPLTNLIFEDIFLISYYYNDNYDKTIVKKLDQYLTDGPYGYKDGVFDVTVQKDDVVIDAGAWIGDFSAYAVSKGATAYAFEPVEEIFSILCKTTDLNNGKIIPVKKGLSSKSGEINIWKDQQGGIGNSLIIKDNEEMVEERIDILTLDEFVEDNNLKRVDFIKADIEGAEREMLKGSKSVLKTFAPKLAICTYHLPDDPQVLEKIILEANPNYKIVQLRNKLFAAVVK